ncbi:hypothetical protein [Leucobacter luti]|nr:hypothetical protein [Leucobacter luti]
MDWLALALGIVGFGIAIYQLCKSRSSLEIARDSLVHTQRSLSRNQVIADIGSFDGILDRIDALAKGTDRDALDEQLKIFSIKAHEVSALLSNVEENTGELEIVLVRVGDSVSLARSKLYDDSDEKLSTLVSDSISKVRVLIPQVKAVGKKLQSTPMAPLPTRKGK